LERKQQTRKSNDSKCKFIIDTMIKFGSGKMTNSAKKCWVIRKNQTPFWLKFNNTFSHFSS